VYVCTSPAEKPRPRDASPTITNGMGPCQHHPFRIFGNRPGPIAAKRDIVPCTQPLSVSSLMRAAFCGPELAGVTACGARLAKRGERNISSGETPTIHRISHPSKVRKSQCPAST